MESPLACPASLHPSSAPEPCEQAWAMGRGFGQAILQARLLQKGPQEVRFPADFGPAVTSFCLVADEKA